MSSCSTHPAQGDNERMLLAKLLKLFGGTPCPGDNRPMLLHKLVEQANNACSDCCCTQSGGGGGGGGGGGAFNFRDSADLADGVLYNIAGTVEIGRFAGGSLTLTAGNITLAAGNLGLNAGNATLSNGNLTLSAGNALLSNGNLTLAAGNALLSNGDLTLSSGRITVTSPILIASAPGLTVNQTWNNAGAPIFVGMDVNITDTASPTGNAALVIRGIVNGGDVFRVRKDGTVYGSRFTGLSATQATSQTISDGGTNNAPTLLLLTHDTSGVPVADFGGTIEFQAETSTTIGRTQSKIQSQWTDATDATRTAKVDIYTELSAAPVRAVSFLGTQTQHPDGTVLLPSISFINEPSSGLYRSGAGTFNFTIGGVAISSLTTTSFTLTAAAALQWGSVGVTLPDLMLRRESAGTLVQYNGVNTQQFKIYHTWANAGADYQRQGFYFSSYSGVVTAIWRAMGGGALSGAGNPMNLFLQPFESSGYIGAGPPPDGAATGGNVRGQMAIDLQLKRSAAASVASGTYSTLVGGNNNKASSTNSVVVGGGSNAATGPNAAVVGGSGSTASGDTAVAFGSSCTAAGVVSFANGFEAHATKYGQRSFASGKFTAIGDAQCSILTARRQSVDGTAAVELFLDGALAASRCTIASDSSWVYEVTVAARNTSANEDAAYRFTGMLRNNAGTTTYTEYLKETLHETVAAWDADVVADDGNDSLKVQVTGEAGKTINWVAKIFLTEVIA